MPVICIGNFTAGGSGKTPLALLVAQLVADEGREPWFLSRGYGGRLPGPIQVAPDVHGSADVGDEPLLLARRAPTVIARNRAAGAQFIEATAPANAVIIMDDGLQNPFLAKELVIAVVSGDRGFGNGHVIPAGPLRAPLAAQIGLADTIVVTGHEASELEEALEDLPVTFARNARYEEGMGTSIAAGVCSASAGAAGFLFIPGDMPRLRPDTLARLVTPGLAEGSPSTGAAIVTCRATWGRTAPTYFDARYRPELEALTGDEGARILLRRHAENVAELAVDDAEVSDID